MLSSGIGLDLGPLVFILKTLLACASWAQGFYLSPVLSDLILGYLKPWDFSSKTLCCDNFHIRPCVLPWGQSRDSSQGLLASDQLDSIPKSGLNPWLQAKVHKERVSSSDASILARSLSSITCDVPCQPDEFKAVTHLEDEETAEWICSTTCLK